MGAFLSGLGSFASTMGKNMLTDPNSQQKQGWGNYLHEMTGYTPPPAKPIESIPGYQAGGFPQVGKPAIVGENGPEMLIPQEPLQVLPNTQMPEPKYQPPMGGGLTDLVPQNDPVHQQLQQHMQHVAQQTQQYDQQQDQKPQGFWHKLAHGMNVAANVAGNIVEPELMKYIPGTQSYKIGQQNARIGQLKDYEKQQLSEQEVASKAGLQGAQADYYSQRGTALQPHEVTAEEAGAMGLPQLEGSLMDPKKWEDLVKQQGINTTKVETTGMQDTTKLGVAHAAGANKTQPHITTMGADGKSHIMERDPATGQYSIDRGIAPPSFGQVAGDIRFAPPLLDTAEGNAPRIMTANQFNRATAGGNQDRFMPAASGTQALTRTALIEDIRGNINQVRGVLQSGIEPFTADQRAKLAIAMGRGDKGAIDAMLTGEFIQSLSPKQQDYVVNLAQLVENGMAMRSVLGAGQGSDQLRDAIRRTIPTAANPTPEYGLKQLQAFENVINRLERGVPAVKLAGENPNNASKETREYQGHTYEKGDDGQWHLQQPKKK